MDLAGKVALVTGSTRGIGSAIARRLAHDGADVAVHGRRDEGPSAEAGDTLCRSIRESGRRAERFAADITSKGQVTEMMDAVASSLGRLDVLILNAARSPFKESSRLLERDLRMLVDTNFLGPMFCVQRALPLLERAGGRIVFISSLGSRYMNPQYPLGAMKAAMEAQVRQWAEEFAARDISVNAVCAGLVKTDSFKTLRRIWPELGALPEDVFVTPEEVASVVSFLCGPAATALRGQTLVVDRGLSNRLLHRS